MGSRHLFRLLAALSATTVACASHPAPGPPPELPVAMPSQVEAGRVSPGAGEAIPRPVARPLPAPEREVFAPRVIYRVQLLATANGALAESRAEELRRSFAESVRVDHEGNWFKVRVGECAQREIADALRRRAIALGIVDAFVVEANGPAR